jgi:hypothetical protein
MNFLFFYLLSLSAATSFVVSLTCTTNQYSARHRMVVCLVIHDPPVQECDATAVSLKPSGWYHPKRS